MAKPNWNKWKQLKSWSLAEAAFLSCDQEPPSPMSEAAIRNASPEVRERYERICAAVDAGELKTVTGQMALQ